MTDDFDPSGPAASDGLFGLPHAPAQARVHVLPVRFEATTSYRRGTAGAPDAIRVASGQVELWDAETGSPWRAGIAMIEPDPSLSDLNAAACLDAERARNGDDDARARVNEAGATLDAFVDAWTTARLDAGRIPAVLGGDHAVAAGALQAAARHHPGLGILQIDAHADLRDAYEGFTSSHASVIFNALQAAGGDLGHLVQVGVRDQCEEEHRLATEHPRITQWSDLALTAALGRGTPWAQLVEDILAPLPQEVWITFDVDGLDPALCPATGTPVPGGLSWRETLVLLAALGRSGRRIVGFDLCEVGSDEWDAIVGARLLYKMAGWAIASAENTGGVDARS